MATNPKERSEGEVKIWKGKLRLKGGRGAEGPEVEARIVLGASVLFEASADGGKTWSTCEPSAVHADSWLRALGETGTEVG
jgi:hypothetical protein